MVLESRTTSEAFSYSKAYFSYSKSGISGLGNNTFVTWTEGNVYCCRKVEYIYGQNLNGLQITVHGVGKVTGEVYYPYNLR